MSSFVHNNAVEAPDGVRRVFNTPEPYEAGTIHAVVNGRVYSVGWTALTGTAVEFEEAPGTGDIVAFVYQQA